MYSVIEEVLSYPEYISFKCVIHIPLNSIVKDFTKLDYEQRKFSKDLTSSHLLWGLTP